MSMKDVMLLRIFNSGRSGFRINKHKIIYILTVILFKLGMPCSSKSRTNWFIYLQKATFTLIYILIVYVLLACNYNANV